MPNGKANKNKSATKQGAKTGAQSAKAPAKAGPPHVKAAAKAKTNRKNPGSDGRAEAAISRGLALDGSIERDLARALSVPNLYPSYRIQDGYASMPTGCASPFMCQPAAFTTTDGSAADALGIPNDEIWAIATRDPRCALRYYDPIGGTYTYRAYGSNGVSANDLNSGDKLDIAVWYAVAGTIYPHGPIFYLGTDSNIDGEGTGWTLGQKNQTLTMDGFVAAANVITYINVLIGNDVVPFATGAIAASGAGVCTIPMTSFIRVDNQTDLLPSFFHWGDISFDESSTNGVLTVSGSAAVLRQMALGDWEDVAFIFEKIRFNSINLMFSNTAAELSKNGYAAGWQVPSDMDWITVMGQGYEELANKPQASRMLVKNGIHGFWKSTSAKDWEYINVGTSDVTAYSDDSARYSLYAQSDTLIICAKIPDAAGRAGYWTVFSDTEQRHNSVWFGDGYPDHERRHFERALEIQARLPQWHENPFHIKDIFRWIGKNSNKIDRTVRSGLGIATGVNDIIEAWM